MLPFYRDCNSHKDGATQTHIEKGKNEVLESWCYKRNFLSASYLIMNRAIAGTYCVREKYCSVLVFWKGLRIYHRLTHRVCYFVCIGAVKRNNLLKGPVRSGETINDFFPHCIPSYYAFFS